MKKQVEKGKKRKEEERYDFKICLFFSIAFHPAGAKLKKRKKKKGKVCIL